MCPKVRNEDGGMTPVNEGANVANYKGQGPFLIDGKGIVRRVFVADGRDFDVQAARSIQFLMSEQTQQAAAARTDVSVSAVSLHSER
jgi:hypothetical protein